MALSQATRVQTPVGRLKIRIVKNRSAQEGLDMKIIAGLDKIGLFRKRWISKKDWKNRSVEEGLEMKIVAGLDKIGLFRRGWI